MRTFARVTEYRLNGQQDSSGATQQCDAAVCAAVTSEATKCVLQAHVSADRTEHSTAINDDRTGATLRAEAAELRGASALPIGRRWADRARCDWLSVRFRLSASSLVPQ